MFGIYPENTIELVNATNEELEAQYKLIFNRILLLSRVLGKDTGILGINGMQQGFLWDKIKKSALKLEESFDSIDIEFEAQDQKTILELVKLQEDADRKGEKLPTNYSTKKICGVKWSVLKDYVMTG